MPKKKSIKSPQAVWETVSSISVNFVEKIFYSLGVIVANHPWKTVIITLTFVCLSCIGLLKFHTEKNPMKLWVPPDSDFYYDTNWYINKFGTAFRLQKIIVAADDVLDPQVLKTIYNITNQVNSISLDYENKILTINDLCYKVPIVNIFNSNRKTRSVNAVSANSNQSIYRDSENVFIDPTLWADDEFYCSFLKDFQLSCLQNNIIDIWSNDLEELNNLNKSDIVRQVNKIKNNPVTGHPLDYSKLLGGAQYDENGNIVSASSVILTWFTQVNMSEVDLNEVGNLIGTEDWVSVPLSLWEYKFLELMKNVSNESDDVKLYYEAGRSFADITGDSMFYELDKLFLGILLMYLYIQFGLSRCNWLEIRLTLGGVGLLCVGLAYISAVSWCSVLGVSFGPVHVSLPFLLMGLGVDDMFVMNACWRNLNTAEKKKNHAVKIGLMLKHAGVSIVITSFTDIVALLIGAITILPSLRAFCIYAAVGVFFIFCFSVTFFVAVFSLDVKRIESQRNGILFCYQHKTEIILSTEKSMFQKLFDAFYKHVIFTIPGKITIILFTLVITGFSIQSILRLEQRFDPKWFIPEDTYYKQFINAYDKYYPEEGHAAMVFLGEINYSKDFSNLYEMKEILSKETYIKDMVSWIDYFHRYVLKNYNQDLRNVSVVPEEKFKSYLSRFLFSPVGGRFQLNFKFSEDLKCGAPISNILATSISFKFTKFQGPEEYIPAMNRAKSLVKSANITTGNGYRSVWSKVFGNWVTDEVIAVEVERNLELALVCVMVCTVILITNLQMCLWIFICVTLTLVNVLGWMQRWGMTVDIVCCIGLELAIGLCVDYAAHVGHSFLTVSEGSRSERAFKTVTSIGTAVLLGGGSTLLSLSLLSMSESYIFKSFFKIFLLVILFGLFYGLIFLPVILSLVGPGAYKSKKPKELEAETVELNGKHDLNSIEI